MSIPLLQTLAQRQGFRTYLYGLLFPRDQFKTLKALVGTELLIQPQAAEVQWLQVFLSEATCYAKAINVKRLALLAAEPATAASAEGVLIIDNTGDSQGRQRHRSRGAPVSGFCRENRQRHREYDPSCGPTRRITACCM